MHHRLPLALRSSLLTASMIIPVFALGVISLAQDAPAPKVPTAKEKFKNIKVLNDLPADQLIPVMRKMNMALGVKCDYCHVAARDKDDKPEKEAARQMAIMTGDINKRHKSVAGKVTCFTCHHGHAQPETPETAEKSDKPAKP